MNDKQPKNKKDCHLKVLDGVRVLDFTGVIAGSYCTRMLSDLGADVLKIEHPAGDIMRNVSPLRGESSAVYGSLNMGKRSLALDLKKDKAVEICKNLVGKYDVVVENFSPGVMSRLGLSYEELCKANPEVIMCSISGYGQSGPGAQRPAFAPIVQAASGFDIAYLENQPNLRKPLNMGPPVGDTTAALQAFGALSAALYYRSRTGIGQHIDVAMMDCLLSTMHRDFQSVLLDDNVARRYGPIETATGFIIVTPLTHSQFHRLADCLGQPQLLQDARFRTDKNRFDNYNELMEITENWTKKLSSEQAVEAFSKAKIPCSDYKTLAQTVSDPQIKHRNIIIQIEDELGSYKVVDAPVRFSETTTGGKRFVADIGEHTVSALQEELSMTTQDIKKLIESGIIFVRKDS